MLNRKTEDIEELLSGLREAYGPHAVVPWGGWGDADSVGFRIRGIPASFSVLSLSRLPDRHFDIRIESHPQDLEYVYVGRVSLWGFLDLVRLMSGPRENWPGTIQPTESKHNHYH